MATKPPFPVQRTLLAQLNERTGWSPFSASWRYANP